MPRERAKFPRIDAHRDSAAAKRFLADFGAAATAAGIELPAVGEALEMLARANDHQRERRGVLQTQKAEQRRLAEGLVDGELNLAGAAKQGAVVDSNSAATLARAVTETETVATSRSLQHVGDSLPVDLFDECRRIVADTIEEVRGLRTPLGDARTAEQAVRLGAKGAVAWARYLELMPQWNGAHELVRLARTQHWIEPLPLTTEGSGGTHGLGIAHGRRPLYARPWEITEARRLAKINGVAFLHLLDPVCDAAEPGGPYTGDEYLQIVAALQDAVVGQVRAENARMRPGVVR